MNYICFPICSLLFILILLIVFLSKKHINLFETVCFKYILIINVFELIFELLCYYSINNLSINYNLNMFVLKFYVLLVFFWMMCFNNYVFLITDVDYINNNKTKNSNYIVKFTILLSFLFAIVTFSTKLNVYNDGIKFYTYGLSINVLAVILLVLVFVWIIRLLINFNKIKRNVIKKYIGVIFIIIFIGIIGALVQTIDKSILIISTLHALSTITMYFTIENPDLKLLEEIEKTRELSDKNVEEKANLLFKVYDDIKVPIRKIELLSDKILKNKELNQIYVDAEDINLFSKDINNVINDVFNVNKYNIVNLKRFDISYNPYNIFKELVILFKERISNGVKFNYYISGNIPNKLYGDPLRVKQVIYTLLENSIKNTSDGVINIDISSIVKDNISRLIINVSYTGIGIDSMKANEILDNNYNKGFDDLEEIKSLDVGIKNIKRFVDMLGGILLIKSKDNSGNSITVILNQEIVQEKNDSVFDKFFDVFTNKRRVLLICDDFEELNKLSSELKNNNLIVNTSVYGMDLVQKIESEERYDLIFIDDEMQPDNAVEIVKKVNIKNQNVIIMLNKEKETIKNHYLEDYNFKDYLLKDNYKEEIKRIIDKF